MKRLQNSAYTQSPRSTQKSLQLSLNDITETKNKRTIWTIGHSNVSGEMLREKLRSYGIDRVVDVRSRPYSRWCPQFNREALEYSFAEADINYDWRGRSLGGLLENKGYEEAIQWVFDRAEYENIALMCSEGNYLKCHRYSMLTPDLELLGAELVHISYK